MRAYLALFKTRFAVLFQYRAAALAGLATQIFWGIVKVMILTAFYAQSTSPQPITLLQGTTFIWLGQALLQLLPWNIDKEVEAQVKNGNVAYELIRPLDLYWHWFFRSMAMRLVPTLAAQYSFVYRCAPLFRSSYTGLMAGCGSVQPLFNFIRIAIVGHYDDGDHLSVLDGLRRGVRAPSATCRHSSLRHGCPAALISRLDAAFLEHSAIPLHHRYSLPLIHRGHPGR